MARLFVTLLVVSMVYMKLCAGQGSPLCTVNSTPKPCGSMCEPTCDDPNQASCVPNYGGLCPNQCRCNSGYVRDTNTNQCVTLDQCSS